MRERLPLVFSATALVVAVLGSTPLGESATRLVLPKNSVGTPQLRNGAVNSLKVKNGTLVRADFKPGVLAAGARGPAGPQGTQGPAGPAGPAGPSGPAGSIANAAAGGDLTGAYPNPQLGPDVVAAAEIRNGSLTARDVSKVSGTVLVDLPSVPGNTCTTRVLSVTNADAFDYGFALPTGNLPNGLVVFPTFNSTTGNAVIVRVCNVTGGALDAPQGGWRYIVFSP